MMQGQHVSGNQGRWHDGVTLTGEHSGVEPRRAGVKAYGLQGMRGRLNSLAVQIVEAGSGMRL